jgi:hypothetical protein
MGLIISVEFTLITVGGPYPDFQGTYVDCTHTVRGQLCEYIAEMTFSRRASGKSVAWMIQRAGVYTTCGGTLAVGEI